MQDRSDSVQILGPPCSKSPSNHRNDRQQQIMTTDTEKKHPGRQCSRDDDVWRWYNGGTLKMVIGCGRRSYINNQSCCSCVVTKVAAVEVLRNITSELGGTKTLLRRLATMRSTTTDKARHRCGMVPTSAGAACSPW